MKQRLKTKNVDIFRFPVYYYNISSCDQQDRLNTKYQ